MTTGRTLDRRDPASLAYHEDFSADKLLAEVIASTRAEGECIQTHAGRESRNQGRSLSRAPLFSLNGCVPRTLMPFNCIKEQPLVHLDPGLVISHFGSQGARAC